VSASSNVARRAAARIHNPSINAPFPGIVDPPIPGTSSRQINPPRPLQSLAILPHLVSRMPKRPPSKNRPHAPARVPRRSGQTMLRIYEQLREQILDGLIPQGEHISIQSIASAMKSSNGPVISALGRLSHEGFVIHQRGHGYRIAEWTPQLLDNLLVVRRALETEAARLAARRAGPEDIDRLQAHITRMAELVSQGRRSDADRVDVELHVAIARLSRSSELIEALGRSHMLEIVRRRLQTYRPRGDFENLAKNHQILVDAIASGDAENAGRAMHEHLRGSVEDAR
jgi:DNA-binding GntR family transcriptional regulator